MYPGLYIISSTKQRFMLVVCRVLVTTDKSCISRSICQVIYFLDYLIPSKLGQYLDPDPVVETATLRERK